MIAVTPVQQGFDFGLRRQIVLRLNGSVRHARDHWFTEVEQ